MSTAGVRARPVLEAIARSEGPDDLLRATVDGIVGLFGFEHVGVYLHDGARSGLVLAARNSSYGDTPPLGTRLPYGHGIIGKAVSRRRRQVRQGRTIAPDPPWVRPATKSQAAIPLTAAGECLGVLDLQSPNEKAFSPAALSVLSRIGRTAGLALYHAFRGNQQAGRARLLQAVFDAAATGVLMVGRDGRISFANRRMNELMAAGSGGGLTGRSFDESFWPLLTGALRRPPVYGPDAVRSAMARDDELEEDLYLRSPADGALRRWCGPVRDDRGGFVGWVELYEDVTAERLATRRLEAAAKIAKATGSGRDLNAVFAGFVASLRGMVDFDLVVCVSHKRSQVMVVRAAARGPGEVSVSLGDQWGAEQAEICSWSLQGPAIVGGLQEPQEPCLLSSILAAEGMEQACVLELKVNHERLGVLAVASAAKTPAYTADDLVFLATAAEFLALAVRSCLLHEELLVSSGQAAERAALLAAVNRASRRLSSSLEIDRILDEVVRFLITDLKVASAGVYLPGDADQGCVPVLGCGPGYEGGRAAAADGADDRAAVSAAAEGRRVLSGGTLALPVTFGEQITGVIRLTAREGHPFTEFDVLGAETVADHLAVAMHNAGLYKQARDLHLAIAQSLAAVVETRDPYSLGHSSRVAEYALMIAGRLGIDSQSVESLRLAAMLHDIGKVIVEDAVLTKRGPLDAVERALVMEHPAAGASILEVTPALAGLAPIVRSHHEWFRGGGYPDGLAADGIPLSARIVAVADAFDAMTSDRPYRTALGIDEALRRLSEGAGEQFDPEVVCALGEAIAAARAADDAAWRKHEERISVERQGGAVPGPEAREDGPGRILPVHSKALSVMYRVSLETGSILQRKQLLQRILGILHDTMGKHKYTILLFAPGSEDLVVEAEMGFGPLVRGYRVPAGRGLTNWVAEHGTPIVVKDVERDPRYFPAPGINIRSELAVPLVARGQVIGALDIESELPGAFTTEDLYLVTAVAGQISTAIDAAQQHEEVARAAIIDGLTGLYNHSHFYERLSEELHRSKRYGHPLVVGLADVDAMKAVNDRHGHLCGDAALRAIADRLRANLRDSDLVARYGGDEFAIIMPETSLPEVLSAAKRIAEATRGRQVTSGADTFDLPRLSFGFAACPQDGDSVEALVQKADVRLYEEKGAKGLLPGLALSAAGSQPAGF